MGRPLRGLVTAFALPLDAIATCRLRLAITTPTVFLSIVGINQVTGHGSATVSLTAGEHP